MDYWEDYEVLKVETPELLELRLPLAGIGPRFLAALVDYLIVGIIETLLIVGLLFFAGMGAAFNASTAPTGGMVLTLIAVCLVVGILLPLLYFVILESMWQGQTIGKRLAGIRVLRRDGTAISSQDALVRGLLKMIDWLPANGITGLVSFFATKSQQRLGDLAAGTVVVKEFASRLPLNWAAAERHTSPIPGLLTPAFQQAATSYLQRCSTLATSVREDICDKCIRSLGYDSGLMSLAEKEAYLGTVVSGSWTQRRA